MLESIAKIVVVTYIMFLLFNFFGYLLPMAIRTLCYSRKLRKEIDRKNNVSAGFANPNIFSKS